MTYENKPTPLYVERLEQLLMMPSRLIRILARKHGVNDSGSLALLRRELASIDDILEDEDFKDWQ